VTQEVRAGMLSDMGVDVVVAIKDRQARTRMTESAAA